MRTWLILGVCAGLAACDINSSEVGGVNDQVGNTGGAAGSGSAGSAGSSGSGATSGSGGSGATSGSGGNAGAGGLYCDDVAGDLRAFAAANNTCEVREDCRDITPLCLLPDVCEQNLTNKDYDADQYQDLVNRANACATWVCGGCTIAWGEPDCVDNSCVPGTLHQPCQSGSDCNAGQFCDKTNGKDGICTDQPEGCPTAECLGVCGEDGKAYCNACEAHKNGVDDVVGDSCNLGGKQSGEICDLDDDCQGGLKCCYPCGIAGCDNQCAVPEPSGECPALP